MMQINSIIIRVIMMNKILIVEDEKAINELIRISLTDAGLSLIKI